MRRRSRERKREEELLGLLERSRLRGTEKRIERERKRKRKERKERRV